MLARMSVENPFVALSDGLTESLARMLQPGVLATLRFLFAKIRVDECYGDVTTTMWRRVSVWRNVSSTKSRQRGTPASG